MNELDKKYKKIKGFLDTMETINKEFVEEEGLTKEYSSPFCEMYNLKSIITKIRRRVINYTIEKEGGVNCPNITIDTEEIIKKITEKYGELGFSSSFIKNYIETHYFFKKAEELSYQEILKEAKKAMPTKWEHAEPKEAELSDIWEKDKLKLRMHLDGHYGYHLYERKRTLEAIEKLVRIVIEGEPAVRVKAFYLSEMLSDTDHIFQTHTVHGRSIVKVKPHKNGKLLIWFEDEETAKKVAQALLG